MRRPPTPTVFHLDVDAFFASVEQRDDPALRGRPVAVGTGVVASCSYEARDYGVRTGMRLVDARHTCRELLVLPGEYPRYEQAARRILAVCLDRTPIVEVAALDDIYMNVNPSDPDSGLAKALREQIHEEVRLSVSIGVGSNKLVAKVATKEAKPGRCHNVPPGAEQAYLAPWPTRVLPGVGPQVQSRLDRLNVHRVAEIVPIPLPTLRGILGTRGVVLHEQSRGIDRRTVEPRKPPQTVSRKTSFDPPVADLPFLKAMLVYLLDRAVTWMRFQHLAARGMTVSLRYGDYVGEDGRELFREPLDRVETMREAALDRFERLYQRRLPLRALGVELDPLVVPKAVSELFPDAQAERMRRLASCKDAIHERFGFMAIGNGTTLLLAKRLDHDRENFRLRTPCLTR